MDTLFYSRLLDASKSSLAGLDNNNMMFMLKLVAYVICLGHFRTSNFSSIEKHVLPCSRDCLFSILNNILAHRFVYYNRANLLKIRNISVGLCTVVHNTSLK